ncbi:MAG: penicillin-binding protein 1C [Campylobacter sp.]|nr:penicillin-binding protein 1C [Campylobacter sp.]
MKSIFKFGYFIAILIVVLSALCLLLDRAFPLNLELLNRPQSQILYDKNGEILYMQMASDEIWRFDVKEDEIPPLLKKSTLAFEDRYFYYHFGINPFSILRSFYHNLTSQNRIGASTITMQVARMINPKERSYKNKVIEIFNALQLEFYLNKDEILTLYFNLAPYGGNIEGIKAASWFYFGKEPSKLSLSQMALLSVIPKNPNVNRLDRISNIDSVKNSVLDELLKISVIDESMHKRASKESFKNFRATSVKNAYHYSNLTLENNMTNSNLDLNLQNFITNLAKELVFKFKDINNASVIVIDNRLMNVIAYVGSHDLNADDGFNDGILASRNVGSTLKPFIYALAFQKGLITPKTRLFDTQIYLSGYTPTNFSNEFLGVVEAGDALIFSLNTTAVFLNTLLKDDSLYEILLKAGLAKEKKSFYGASIALGGISLSLLDLTHLFTIFANDGKLKPLEVAGKVIDKNEKLLTPQSVYLVNEILSNSNRIYLNSVWQNTQNAPRIAFKTGTSAKSIDLLTIAYNKEYTVGVWLGNFNGKSSGDTTGARTASLLAFDIFSYLSKKESLSFFEPVEGVKKDKICLDILPSNICKKQSVDFVIEGIKLASKCEILSNENINFLLTNGYISTDELKSSKCFNKFKDRKPLLATPLDGSILFINPAIKKSKIMVKCFSFIGGEIYLNVDKQEYFKANSGEEISLFLDLGFHTINCLDENSNLVSSKIIIKDI